MFRAAFFISAGRMAIAAAQQISSAGAETPRRVASFRRNRWLAGRYSADARNCGSEGDSFGVWCRHRTRVAANEGVPEMPVVLPSRSTPIRSYSAIALFLVVYVGVLFVIFAPRDMIAVESGVAFYGAED